MPEETPQLAKAVLPWEVTTLRLTCFLSPRADVGDVEWWKEIVGQVPEKEVKLPRRGSKKQEGPFGEGKLILSIKFNRIDWVFTVNPNEDPDDPTMPSLGLFTQTLALFQSMMERWLHKAPQTQRLAFGAVLISPVSDRVSGYEKLQVLLPSVQLDSQGSSEFLYRINRPRLSNKIEGLSINRLSKWAVESWNYMEMSLPLQLDSPIQQGQQHFACSLELDINTSVEFQTDLPTDQVPAVFSELISLGMEISEKGDIA